MGEQTLRGISLTSGERESLEIETPERWEVRYSAQQSLLDFTRVIASCVFFPAVFGMCAFLVNIQRGPRLLECNKTHRNTP